MQLKIPKFALSPQHSLSVVLILAVLLTFLPGQVLAASNAAPTMSPLQQYGGDYYWVKRGDTLSQIAQWYGVSLQALMYANGIRNPNHIYVGQKLYIPSGYDNHDGDYGHGHDDDYDHDDGGHGDGGMGGPQCAFYHTVQRGQTLAAIANYYGVNVYTLAQINGIYNVNRVYSGQRLCIPSGYTPAPPPPHKPEHKPPHRPEPQQPPPSSAECVYVVHYGDTLAKIAYWYFTDVQTLLYLNNMSDVNQLYVGQELHLPGRNCPASPAPTPAPEPYGAWTGAYFNNKYLQGAAVYTRQDGAINFDWGGGGPGNGVPDDRFSVAWDSTTTFTAGTYRFYATVDDGVRVYVDGHLIIDSWREQPATTYYGDIYLGEGNHALRVEYYEEGGTASIRVWWSRL
ncbi:MAG: LysM peptidoglycan-binding domain-containing protein [Caldilineaceae bacterium]